MTIKPWSISWRHIQSIMFWSLRRLWVRTDSGTGTMRLTANQLWKPTKSSCKTISVTFDMASKLSHTLRKLTKKPHHGACWPYCCNARNWAIQRNFKLSLASFYLSFWSYARRQLRPITLESCTTRVAINNSLNSRMLSLDETANF